MSTPKKRVVLLTHEFYPFHGGVSIYCQELARALHQEGETVEVWVPAYSPSVPAEKLFPFLVRHLPLAGRLTPWDIGKLTFCLLKHRRELSETHLVTASHGAFLAVICAGLLNSHLGKKVICIFHGSELLKIRDSPLLSYLARKWAGQDRLFFGAVSHYTRDLAKEVLGQAKREIHLLPGAPSSAACQSLFKPFPVPPERKVLLTVARVHPRKGQWDVARALSLLGDDLKKQIVYRMAGAGDHEYLRLIQETCRQGGISLEYLGEGSDQDLPSLYEACDLFIMPSRRLKKSVEGLGLAYLEAAFHGKPSLGYRTGGVGEAVRDGETGLLVEEGNIEALAEALEKLLTDAELRRRFGEKARHFAQNFSWKKTAQNLMEIIGE